MSGALRGVTLVEMVVAMAIMAILLTMSLPSLSAHMANMAVRNSAESLYAAAQRARAEAIRRNEPVDLVLTDDIPNNAAGAANNIATLTESATGRNWVVRAPNQAVSRQLIDMKLGAESAASKVAVNAGAVGRIQFNGLGESSNAATVAVTLSHQSLNTNCALAESVRCVSVRISPGGQARLCEPGQPITDPRSC